MAELVQATWPKVEAVGLEVGGVMFFKRIFEIAPGALQLFSFKDEKNLYESPALKKHAITVMKTVGVAVGGLGDLTALVPILTELGRKHVGYGVLPEHYDIVGAALLWTLEQALGDAWTEDVKAAWTEIYGIVATTMIGNHYEPVKAEKNSAMDWYMNPTPAQRGA
mmetsp:Transcript_21778/g.37186  ORF Transcript_21778/g.37186 Transcript_21778/m.37186 type:complete len:166 (+) Transcript_21778:47-544(+)